jgi:hypothetical protein
MYLGKKIAFVILILVISIDGTQVVNRIFIPWKMFYQTSTLMLRVIEPSMGGLVLCIVASDLIIDVMLM